MAGSWDVVKVGEEEDPWKVTTIGDQKDPWSVAQIGEAKTAEVKPPESKTWEDRLGEKILETGKKFLFAPISEEERFQIAEQYGIPLEQVPTKRSGHTLSTLETMSYMLPGIVKVPGAAKFLTAQSAKPTVEERILEKLPSVSKTPEELIPSVTRTPEALPGGYPLPIKETKDIQELASELIGPKPVTPKEPSITELASKALYPTPGFRKTAEELAQTKYPIQPKEPVGRFPLPVKAIQQLKTAKGRIKAEMAEPVLQRPMEKMTPEEYQPIAAAAEGRQLPGIIKNKVIGEEIPKYAQSINLEKLDVVDDVKRIMLAASKEKVRVPWSETVQRAQEMGLDPDKLLKQTQLPKENLAAHIEAARQVNLNAAKSLHDIMKAIPEDELSRSPEMMAKAISAVNKYQQIFQTTSKESAEIGRALGIHRRVLLPEKQFMKHADAIIEAMGGKDVTNEMINRLQKLDWTNPVEVNGFIRDLGKAKTADKIVEIWRNFLVSGIKTHMVNTTSNALTFLSKYPERLIGRGIDLMRAKITRTPQERFFGELPHEMFGIWQGTKEGVRKGLAAFIREIPEDAITKLDVYAAQAIPGKIGKIIRIPQRALTAEDEFFKAINYQSELHGLAYRKAVQEGLSGQARINRIADILSNPTDELVGQAQTEMLYRVFQKPLGELGKTALRIRQRYPILNAIAPFIKTPVNIAKFGLERTPLNYFRIARMVAKGELKGGALSDEVAKATMGSLIGLAVWMHAKEGKITGGGPKDTNAREALYRTGWQPYSIKMGNKYYQYGRLEPLGMVMGLSADAAEIWETMNDEENANIAGLIATSIGKNLSSKTFLSGVSDAMNAITDPERFGERWVQSFARSSVPRLIGGIAQAYDPTLRKPETVEEVIKTQIPTLSEEVTPRRDLWGEPIQREGTFLTRLISPGGVSVQKADKINFEMIRLGLDNIGLPRNRIRDVELSTEEHDRYIAEAGRAAKKKLDELITSDLYGKIDDEHKAKRIRDIILDERDRVARRIWHGISEDRKALAKAKP